MRSTALLRHRHALVVLLAAVLSILGSGLIATPASAALPPCPYCEPGPGDPQPPEPETQIVKAPPAGFTTDPQPDFSFRIPNGVPGILQYFICSQVGDTETLWEPTSAFDCPSAPSFTGDEVHFPYGGDFPDGVIRLRVMGCQSTWGGSRNCDRSPSLVTLRIDRTGPTLSFSAGTPAAGAHLTTKQFIAAWQTAEAGVTGYTCVLDGGAPFQNCGMATQLTFQTEGSHTLSITAKDALGNVGPALTRTWVIDTIAPVTSITTAPPAVTASRRPAFVFGAADADATLTASCTLQGPSGTTTPACGPTGWTPTSDLADGAYTFSVKHTDRAGNIGTSKQATFRVEGTPDPTPTPTVTPTPTPSPSPSPTPTPTASPIPTPTATPTPTPTPTVPPSTTPAPTVSPATTPAPTAAPSSGSTPTPAPNPVGPLPGLPVGTTAQGAGGSASTGSTGSGATGAAPTPSPTTGANVVLSERSSPEQVADAFGLPSAKACLSKRSFPIRLKVPKGVKVKSASIVVNGKTVKARLTKGRWQATVDLRGLKKNLVPVRITIKTAAGKTLRGSRTYGVCGAKRGA